MNTSTAGAAAVITGMGVIAPTGIGSEEHWQAVLNGKTGIGPITRFDPSGYPVRLAGEVADFTAKGRVPARLVPQTDRWTHLALAAADAAVADSAVDPASLPEYEMAVVTASSSGGTDFGQHEMERLYQNGPSWVGAYQSIAWFYAATTGQVSIRHGMRGPCGVVCTEQAGGLDAIGQARRLLRDQSRLVVTGGTDSSLCPYGLVAQMANGHLSTAEEAGRAYLPFDVEAGGYVPGEGGAILVAERSGPATEGRGYGRVLGYAAGFDQSARTGRRPVLAGTIRRALDDARCAPDDIDVVFADAAADPDLDLVEAEALAEVFGTHAVPVTAPKTLTGRLYGGGAALDVATALLALRDGVIPHTVGTTRVRADCPLDLVLDVPRERALRTALVVARGYGGFTSAMVLGRGDRPAPAL
ncbi:ketosynthase chain-length factor [Couchioplanes caeruleus]|uniref:Aromatic polyketide synthase KS beta n=2 Tax=Couchioplanes caeruleus TaxID=56438 RepID=A0A1K0GXK2_9ACTN|nr:ketosynthase chain-length factor [Couchioplanes caeruleus]OJF16156.1 Aromatic polyketide synthase KS beta [Couchioplanes caeruleus subsp. caeruleus]ROP34046.1 act minimal PKS chain-length factor (CLF/KS beta) [Couchioplanes caeruleus]